MILRNQLQTTLLKRMLGFNSSCAETLSEEGKKKKRFNFLCDGEKEKGRWVAGLKGVEGENRPGESKSRQLRGQQVHQGGG